MPLITPGRLNSFLSGPEWSDDQWLEAADIVEEVEGELAAQLNAPISAGPQRIETGALLDTGLLALAAPVASVLVLDGTTVTDDVLPTGWTVAHDGCLHYTSGSDLPLPVPAFGYGYGITTHHGFATRSVAITYLPGWGDRPALRSAILRKTANRWLNRHDDTVTARNLDAEAPPSLSEDWTDTDIRRLSVYRWYTAWR